MHPHKSDKVDEEFVNACNSNFKVVSTCSVGYGKPSYSLVPMQTADVQTTSMSRLVMPRASKSAIRLECWTTPWRTSRLCSFS